MGKLTTFTLHNCKQENLGVGYAPTYDNFCFDIWVALIVAIQRKQMFSYAASKEHVPWCAMIFGKPILLFNVRLATELGHIN